MHKNRPRFPQGSRGRNLLEKGYIVERININHIVYWKDPEEINGRDYPIILPNIYLSKNKYNMAIEEYKLAIKYKKDFAFSHYNLGCTYLAQKNYNKAEKQRQS